MRIDDPSTSVGDKNEGGHVYPEVGERFVCPRGGLYRTLDGGDQVLVMIWQEHAAEWRMVLSLSREGARALRRTLDVSLIGMANRSEDVR